MQEPPRALLEQLASARALDGMALVDRLKWLKDAAAAIRGADLGEEGARAALDLDAALGAVVAWSRGDKSERSLVELEAVMRTLVARAMMGLATELSRTYRALADERVHRASCLEVAAAFDDVARSLARGEGIPEDAARRIQAARDALAR